MPGVLAKVVARIDDDPLTGHTHRRSALRERGRAHDDVLHHVVIGDPMRTRARSRATGVRADDPGGKLRRHLGKQRIDPAPRIVHDIGTGKTCRASDFVPPRIDTDHDIRVRASDCLDEGHDATGLLLGRHVLAGSGFYPTNVDDVGALGHDLMHAVHGCVVGP